MGDAGSLHPWLWRTVGALLLTFNSQSSFQRAIPHRHISDARLRSPSIVARADLDRLAAALGRARAGSSQKASVPQRGQLPQGSGSLDNVVKLATMTIDGRRTVEIGPLLGEGSFGSVYAATLDFKTDVVAKCAHAKNQTMERADASLDDEAVAHAQVTDVQGMCEFFGEAESEDGTRYLIFERIRPLNGTDGPPDTCMDIVNHLRDLPISPEEVLRQLLTSISQLHKNGFIHGDVKLENLLLTEPSKGEFIIKLIDFGAAISLEGCTLFQRVFQPCGVDREVCSGTLEYSPPEGCPDPDHPYASDIYSAAICYLRLVWPGVLDTDKAVLKFREQLTAADGDLEVWLRTQLGRSVVPETLLRGFERFPGTNLEAFAAVRAMLSPDAARRPSADALLASSDFLYPGEGQVFFSASEALEDVLYAGCKIPSYDVAERQLAVRASLRKPFGLVLSEAEGGGVFIEDILPEGSAARNGKMQVGDRVASVGDIPLLNMGFDQAMDVIKMFSEKRGFIDFVFERSCSDAGCELDLELTGDLADPAKDIAKTSEVGQESSAASTPLLILDTGMATSIGGRDYQEDTSVLTSFTAETSAGQRSFVLAAVFDGHRGPAASAHAAAHLPSAVSAAIAEADPAPLAVAWRQVVDSYLESGHEDGSTATAMLMGESGAVEIINCGDSRAVIGSSFGSVLFETIDHGADNEAEGERIRASGGTVHCTIGGIERVSVLSTSLNCEVGVACARALGGSEWLSGRISNAADVSHFRLRSSASEIILATDGLWGVLAAETGSAQAIARVRQAREKGYTASQAAQLLQALARKAGSLDNCMVIVLYLDQGEMAQTGVGAQAARP